MKTESPDLHPAVQFSPDPIGIVGEKRAPTFFPMIARWWSGLRRNTGPLLVPATKLAGKNLPVVLAGSMLMAGVTSARAAVQTITIPGGAVSYVTCQVTGTPSNEVDEPTFLSWGPVAFTDQLIFGFIDNCELAAYNHSYVFDGVAWTDDFVTPVSNLTWHRDEVIGVFATVPTSMTLTGIPRLTPVVKTLDPGCLYLLGSQVLGADTFDNIAGHPAADYAAIEVYRSSPGGVADVPGSLPGSGGHDLYYCNAGVWSPPFPMLNAGEGVFIRVNAFPPTTIYPSHAGACTSPALKFFGSDFVGFNASTDTIELTGAGAPIGGSLYATPNSLQVHAVFNLSTATPGAWLNVVITKSGISKTVPNAFRIDPLTMGAATPNQVGEGCASATLTFLGSSICPGATVTLTDVNNVPTTGTAAVVNADGTMITATFDLTLAALGPCSATLVNPDLSAFTAPGALSVVPLVPPQIEVQIRGPGQIGSNGKRQFAVAYRNTGNCEAATGVEIKLTGLPASVALTNLAGAAGTTALGTSDGFVLTVPSLAPSDSYAYCSFYLQADPLGPFPYNVTLTANSLTPYVDSASITIPAVASWDPNDKFGLSGVGAGHYVTGNETFPYEIHFENKPSASAPAQQVFVTDQLDTSTLDLSTFSLGPITFGTRTITPPPGLYEFTTDVLFDVDGNSATGDDVIVVRIVANLETDSLSPNYGRFTCNYLSYDPLTGALPDDPFHGFLPPNLTQPDGEGSVRFTIQPKPGLADATVIANGATIVFDKNAPILTPVWSNTLDLSKPVSAVNTLPAVSSSSHFRVAWNGTDAGSGIASYDIWVSDNGGAATLWLTAVTATSHLFSGTPGHTYQFHSIAHDAMGYVEDPPAMPDATSTVDPNVPYDVWAVLFPTFDLIDSAADLDNDGMTNWQEYAFGLDPTSGSSVSPVAVIPGQTVGTFSYTRRNPALTGLSYTIQTSTNLQEWADDTVATAGETLSVITGEVQTMVATPSASAVDGRLFVRVKAE